MKKGIAYIAAQEIRPGELELPEAWAFEAMALAKAIKAAMAADARITRRKPNYARAFDYVKHNQPELIAAYEAAVRTRRKP